MMMNGLSGTGNSNDVKYPPNVANSRGLSAVEMEVDKLYEPKQNKKIVRIFTVILYMFSVSLGAILLSLYYVFLWKNPHTQAVNRRADNSSTNTLLLDPTLSSDFLGLEDQFADPDQVTQESFQQPLSLREDLKLLQLGVTAFPKASRGVPPVVSRLVDSRQAVDDKDQSGVGAEMGLSLAAKSDLSIQQNFMKKRSLNADRLLHSIDLL